MLRLPGRLLVAITSLLLSGALAAAALAVALLSVLAEPAPSLEGSPAPTGGRPGSVIDTLAGTGAGAADAGLRIYLSARDIEVFADLLAHRLRGGSARVALRERSAEIAASLPLEPRPGGYLNVRVSLVQAGPVPAVSAIEVGGRHLPAALGQLLERAGLGLLRRRLNVRRVTLGADAVTVDYRRGAARAAGSGTMAGERAYRQAMLASQRQLVEIVAAAPRKGNLQLADVLSRLLSAQADGDTAARGARAVPAAPTGTAAAGAGTRLVADGDAAARMSAEMSAGRSAPAEAAVDAATRNRAAILALASYVNGRRFPSHLDDQADLPRWRAVVLRGRRDLAEHFMASAALASEGGSRLSDLLGVAKELRDADGGSGFNVADLTANRAGVRFAELAGRSASGARHVRRLAVAGFTEDAIMPEVKGLPEGLQERDVARTYGAAGAPAFERLIAAIDRRIGETRLYRSAPGG
ncbi:MAG: hypothetical protein K9M02_07690 [Thiohalocapsa sp.]|nr:hypothetical protein [Thiohalocapsa sp.]